MPPSVISSDWVARGVSHVKGYVNVGTEILRRLRHTDVDLFVQYVPRGPVTLYHRAGSSIDTSHFDACQRVGIQHLLVRNDDFELFGKHLLDLVDEDEKNNDVPPAERYATLQLAMAMEIERAAQSTDCGAFVAIAEHVSQRLATMVVRDQLLPYELFRLARHDYSTFTHVTNVAAYAVVLAQRLGTSEEHGLRQIATGAILHDIGKRFIPQAILTKRVRLLPEERALIRLHPTRGYMELCRRSDLTFAQLMMIYQHHERIDGTGYPVGIFGDEIHPWAKILAVVDVFDAMTGIRPYRRPSSVRATLEYLCRHANCHFDAEAVRCWNDAMKQNL